MRRYVYRPGDSALAATVRASVPGAAVTDTPDATEVIIPDAALTLYDRNQPSPATEIEDVPDTTPRLTHVVRSDLLQALRAARSGTLVQVRAALDALAADADTRNRRS